MTQQQQRARQHWSPVWVGVVITLGAIAVVMAQRGGVLPFASWGYPMLGVVAAAFAALITMLQQCWMYSYLHRVLYALAPAAWVRWTVDHDFSRGAWTMLVVGAAVLVAMSYVRQPPRPAGEPVPDGSDRRPASVRRWETEIRGVSSHPITVTAVAPWDTPRDGERVHIDLPLGVSAKDLSADWCATLAAAHHLPRGCIIRALEGDHQGAAVLDVMLRDSIADEVQVEPDFSPVSINDEFPIMFTPRHEPLMVGLRRQSMVIGGAPDSGKTTLLHRIILWVARCPDALMWVVDMNGGGVAEPWVRPWAVGDAEHAPIVDWMAADEYEAAALTAVAMAVAKGRKTSRVAVARKRESKSWLLPVDANLPAVVVLTDEGGEVAQASTRFGQQAGQRISQLAQIGRAEGVRVIMSVLRGTADLLDKGLRVNAANRVCLQMLEDGEYVHVLGTEPGRGNRLIHVGAGYLMRKQDLRPILARTVDMSRDDVEDAAMACQHFRAQLDDVGRTDARKVGPADVLGRDPTPEEMRHPVMRDAARGLLYENRWVRQAAKLAEMRGEDLPEPDDEPEPVTAVVSTAVAAVPTLPAGSTGAIADLVAAVAQYGGGELASVPADPAPGTLRDRIDLSDPGAVERAAQAMADAYEQTAVDPFDPLTGRLMPGTETAELPPAEWPARTHILAVLAGRKPEMLTSNQIGVELDKRGINYIRTYRQDVLAKMLKAGDVVRSESRAYGLPTADA